MQLATEVERQARRDNAAQGALPEHWLGAKRTAEQLEGLYRATQAAITRQQWHADQGTYPSAFALPPSSLERQGLRYEVSEGAGGYKIVIAGGQGAGTVLLEQRSSVPSSSR